MARKRLFEEPPPALSSSEEEETDDQEEEPQKGTVRTQQNAAGEKSNDDEDGTEDDEEEDDDGAEVEKKKADLASKTPKPNPVSAFESDSDADSEDTESAQPPSPSLSDFTVKAISPKRKSDTKPEQPKKENDADEEKAQKGSGPGTGGSQRIWSDEDEIMILNGMIKFQNEKGKNSSPDTTDFYVSVKDSLYFNASNNQFVKKIRRLKKKYFTDVETNESGQYEIFSKPHDLECVELAKQIWGAGGIVVGDKSNASENSGENDAVVVVGGGGGGGGGIVLAVAKLGRGGVNGKGKEASVKKGKRGSSEEVSGEGKQGNLKKRKQVLSEKGDEGEEGNVKKEKRILSEEVNGERKGKGGKKEKQAANNELNGGEDANVKKQMSFVSGEWKESSMKKQKEVEGEEGSDDFWDKYPHLRSSLQAEDLPEDVKERAMMMLGKVPEEKLVELEREWRSLMNVKLEFFMMEKDLIAKQMKLVLDGLKSQDY
ncbi:STOREKEEPER PROTEIN-LIKE [Salix viminalis]|uniref:STOREKEEPER PROTEIN-LIKE n=1 Tax=Salix viminalis TaxID=40686 RepID=A0A9Q0UVI7_SALVM|nr:STOREKEEPER PROTEIN-LIKE [Salix viminalis]